MKKRRYTGLLGGALLCYLVSLPVELAAVRFSRADLTGIDKSVIAESVTPFVQRGEFPAAVTLTGRERDYQARLSYTLDEELQNLLSDIYDRYKPDYGSFVALDPATGEVRALTSFVKDGDPLGNLALRATFPAASVFKIVTAAAVLDRDLVGPDSVLPYNGKSSSLYKRQVLRHRDNRWTRRPSLKLAFAKSVNTVFARLGVYELGAEALTNYAERFAFNSRLSSDLQFDLGSAVIAADDWSVAEAASGYTLDNTLSPLHGAMIAGAAAHQGHMMEPRLVSMAVDAHGVPLYSSEPRFWESIEPTTASELRTLMRETVRRGSARGAFRRFFRGPLRDVEVGGKTGSLTGLEPRGRNDWFVGYAALGDKKLAFASLTVNKERWTVKSAYVARRVIETYFADG